MAAIGKFILDYVWGKLLKEGIPWVIEQAKNFFKKNKIEEEVDEEESEVAAVKKEINEWLEKNPDAKEIPKELENKLRDATKRRNDGLYK